LPKVGSFLLVQVLSRWSGLERGRSSAGAPPIAPIAGSQIVRKADTHSVYTGADEHAASGDLSGVTSRPARRGVTAREGTGHRAIWHTLGQKEAVRCLVA